MGEDKSNPRYLDALIELARHGMHEEIKMPTSRLAERISLSQQSASRIMKEMEAGGLISRKIFADGQTVRIEAKGIALLKEQYSMLNSIFSRKKLSLSGSLVSGVGEGKYYIGLKGYRKQFKEKLNFIPYSGTLNIQVDNKAGKLVNSIPEFIMIDGFSTKKKSFGGLKCAKAKIEHSNEQIIAAIIKPFRTVHGDDTLEVIAPYYLRERLRLKDGDKIKIVI